MLSVVVITKTYSTSLGIIRALGRAGCHVELVYIVSRPGKSKIASASRYVHQTTEFVGRNQSELVDLLLSKYAHTNRRWVLFPTDDFSASVIDVYRDSLSPVFVMPHIVGGYAGDITHFMDKEVQSAQAMHCGLPVPQNTVVRLGTDELELPERILYPCFVKPLLSYQGRKSDLVACSNKEELVEHLQHLRAREKRPDVLVQQRIDVTQEYSMSGVCIDQTVILPAVTRKLHVAQYQTGVTLAGMMVPISEIEPVRDSLYAFLRSLHFVGMFDLEFMRSGDDFYFCEINLRPGGPNYFYTSCGVNLPLLLVKALCGEEVEYQGSIILGKTFLYEKVAWEDYRFGYMSKRELKTRYDKADYYLIRNDDDPKPERVFLRFIKPRAYTTRLIRMLRGIHYG